VPQPTQVHYYEDGNVQLTSNKTVAVKVAVDDAESAATKFVQLIEKEENQYQTSISSNYVVMSDTTFKALRRALPITRTKVNWHRTIQQHGLAKDLTKGK
jgi:capping protein alpha